MSTKRNNKRRVARPMVPVVVNRKHYRSTQAAFKDLRIPVSKLVYFRGKLKEAGKAKLAVGKREFAFRLAA